MFIDYFKNLERDATIPVNNLTTVRVASHGSIIASDFQGCYNIESYSCVNRSSVGKYGGLGLHSYISDSSLGRYTFIGSRVSIGGFEHPTDWLSVGAFQWGQSVQEWGLTGDLTKHLLTFPKPNPEKTYVGSDCWIGNNAIVLSGVKISHGAIVGAGSVVTKDLPPFSISVGNPAKVISYRFKPETIEKLLESSWWDRDIEDLSQINFKDIDQAVTQLLA